jgi:hypothetical protein
MTNELVVIGIVGGVVAVGAFGGAVKETFKLNNLRNYYNSIVEEPVPDRLKLVLKSLGDDKNEHK